VIASEIKFAVQAAARKLSEHVKRLEKDKHAGQVRKYLEKYARVVSETLSKMIDADKDEVYSSLIEEISRRRPMVFEEPATSQPIIQKSEAEDVKVED
jgi:DNA topoisomerase VI subunit B